MFCMQYIIHIHTGVTLLASFVFIWLVIVTLCGKYTEKLTELSKHFAHTHKG